MSNNPNAKPLGFQNIMICIQGPLDQILDVRPEKKRRDLTQTETQKRKATTQNRN